MDERTDAREPEEHELSASAAQTPPVTERRELTDTDELLERADKVARAEELRAEEESRSRPELRAMPRADEVTDFRTRVWPGLAPVVSKPKADASLEDALDLWDDDEEEEVLERVWKVPLRVIPADDMTITVGEKRNRAGHVITEGTTYAPHVGETVSFLPAVGVDTMFSTAGLILSNRGKSAKAMARMMTHMETLCDRLANVLAEWTLTGMDGRPLPQPYQNPAVIKSMSEDEVAWLIKHATGQAGETEEARKNA